MLAPETLVVWKGVRGIQLGFFGSFGPSDAEEGIMLYIPVKGGRHAAVKLVESGNAEFPTYQERHYNLIYEGVNLDYMCKDKGYCDEVSILARMKHPIISPPAQLNSEHF